MSQLLNLSGLALRQVVTGALRYLGSEAGQSAVAPVASFLMTRFADHSDRLTAALRLANQDAWLALETSLAGDSMWERFCSRFAAADVRAFRTRVHALLRSLPEKELASLQVEEFRVRCQADLARVRHAGLLTPGAMNAEGLAQETARFAAFGSGPELVEAEWRAIEAMGLRLREDYPYLGRFILLRDRDWPLLAIAARYFLSKRLEKDETLFRQVMLQRDGGLTPAQKAMFGEMHGLLVSHGEKLDQLIEIGQQTHTNVEQLLLLHKALHDRFDALLQEMKALRQHQEVAAVAVVVEVIPEPEPVQALPAGEPLPEVPPRYSAQTAPRTERKDLALREDLWSAEATALANPGAPLAALPEKTEDEPPPRRFGLSSLFDS